MIVIANWRLHFRRGDNGRSRASYQELVCRAKATYASRSQ
jgi:hypothetical protein